MNLKVPITLLTDGPAVVFHMTAKANKTKKISSNNKTKQPSTKTSMFNCK